MFSVPLGRLLIASAIAGIIALSGLLATPVDDTVPSNIYTTSDTTLVKVGETFTLDIVVAATEPVNVFKGLLLFDSMKVVVESIDYNTSIADLWAEEPWYSNGDGTLGFIGGTTKAGGFSGTDKLITVTLRAKDVGETHLKVTDVKLLRYDGLGSEAAVGTPIDAIFTIENPAGSVTTETATAEKTVFITHEVKNTDLNDDGKQSVADISIFMTHLATQNLRSDFNGDGEVTLRDLSILME